MTIAAVFGVTLKPWQVLVLPGTRWCPRCHQRRRATITSDGMAVCLRWRHPVLIPS